MSSWVCPTIKKFNRVDRNFFFAMIVASCVVTLNNQMLWWLNIVSATHIHDVLDGAAEDCTES
jgi:hypothetical protein